MGLFKSNGAWQAKAVPVKQEMYTRVFMFDATPKKQKTGKIPEASL